MREENSEWYLKASGRRRRQNNDKKQAEKKQAHEIFEEPVEQEEFFRKNSDYVPRRRDSRQKNEPEKLQRGVHRHMDRKKTVRARTSMFSIKSISEDTRNILENFDSIIADVRGLNSKQRLYLPNAIKRLSHQLTDNRGERRLGYMNDAESVSAYISYFMWWNLIRLVRLFANMPEKAFSLTDDSVAVDIGSGPLTVPIALWLAHPELRSRKIKWYCMDLSQTALAQGEELYLSIAAKTIANSGDKSITPWSIVRVRGPLGTEIKQKADFVVCANTFNEIIQRNEMPTDFLAKKYSGSLTSYISNDTEKTASVLIVEPGDPHSARFVSLMRDAFIRRNFMPLAPCPHAETCPMAGRTKGEMTGKWCNFGFNTDDAPAKLLKLSEKAGLPKERAVLSFVLARKIPNSVSEKETMFQPENEKLQIRIASDFIKLPELHRSGYYACSSHGLLLAIDEHKIHPENGELLTIQQLPDDCEIDRKSGAIIVHI